MTVASPCTGACTVDAAASACSACGRTLAEIAGWLGMSDAERHAIMQVLEARKAAALFTR